MKTTFFTLLLFFLFITVNAQIGFESHLVLDNTHSTFISNSVYSVDVDGDGDNDIDIISTSESDNKLIWHENIDGLGDFSTEHLISLDIDAVKSIYSTDINNDGYLDVILISDLEDNIYWYENIDGLGNFSNYQIISTNGNEPSSLSLSDFDGDGDSDIVAVGYLSTGNAYTFMFENLDGLGSFSEPQIINDDSTGILSVSSGDIDGDGDIDIICGYQTSLIWLENLDGLGNFSSYNVISNITWAHSISIDDIDNDGDLDVLSGIYWHENTDGLGNFMNDVRIYGHNNGPFGTAVNTGDLNGDGYLDVLFADKNQSTVSWNKNLDGLGTFGNRNNISVNVVAPNQISSGDIDNDGDFDLVCSSIKDQEISWYENLDGNGNFGQQKIISVESSSIEAIFLIDVDGDNDIDVIADGDFGHLVWFENLDGNGNFGSPNIIGTQNQITSITAYDIDMDNDIDIIAGSSNDDTIAWYENLDGQGNFGPQQDISTNADSVQSIYASDLDNDGDLDILSANENDDTVAWYENNNGIFSSHIINSNAESTNVVHAFDIDGDGDNDVIAAANNKIFWHENTDGNGSFGPEIVLENHGIGYISSADLDNDGDLDIYTQYSWYENLDGQGSFGEEQVINNSGFNRHSTVSDINNDGLLDIAYVTWIQVQGDFGGIISWYENLGFLGNQIYGNIKTDLDSNGCNNDDAPLSNIMVSTDNGANTFSTFTQENGDYNLLTNAGNFTTNITTELPSYYNSNPAFYTSNFTGLGNSFEGDFCVEPNQSINDLNISLYPLSDARPGFDASYQIVYKNVGTTILNGDVNLSFDDTKVNFLIASETVDSQTSNSLTFNYTDLNPFETRTIDLDFNVFPPPTTEIGDVLLFTSEINPIIGDNSEADNTFTLEQTVISSYDPNDIQVLEGDEIFVNEIDEYLHYIIRFQNTGTAEAINISITNILDPNLDWNTIQIENISHSNRVEIRDGNQVEFIFDGIYLPDSTTNEEESHGFITYKIKPINTIDIGNSMSNNAQIYFDFNPPIATNTVITTVVENLSVNDNNIENLSIYPNPTDGALQIKSNTSIISVAIYNQLGQVILQENNSGGIKSINIERLEIGMYFIQLKDDKFNTSVKKLLKK